MNTTVGMVGRLSQCTLRALALGCCLAGLAAVAYALGWDRYVPVLGYWEHFEYHYQFGSVDAFLTFVVGPRANLSGKGYPLLELGMAFTDWFGLSLTTFRAFVLLQALAAVALMVVVMSRWFGFVPALFGVTLTVLSTGFVIFSDQVLVLIPTLLLSLVLVERTQAMERGQTQGATLLIISLAVAFLLIQYGTGRYFAVGWLGFFFAARVLAAQKQMGFGRVYLDYVYRQIQLALILATLTVLILILLDYRNIGAIADLRDLFFRRKTSEIEYDLIDWVRTITDNIRLTLEMMFPLPGYGAARPEFLIWGYRAPILNYWHTPFLLLGVAVALCRTFRQPRPGAFPYMALHWISVICIAIMLFSEQLGGASTLSSYRIFNGYIAFAGYIVVAVQAISEWLEDRPRIWRQASAAIAVALLVVATASLHRGGKDMAARIDSLARIDSETGMFAPVPQTFPYGINANSYLHARYARLASLLAPALECAKPGDMVLLRISPSLLLNRGKYDGLHYFRNFNDLSETLALYLGDFETLNPAFAIIHSRNAKGYKDWGHGYGGTPRVFSGPIAWEDGAIRYVAKPPLEFNLRQARPGGDRPIIFISFSEQESRAAGAIARDQAMTLIEPEPLRSLQPIMRTSENGSSRCLL